MDSESQVVFRLLFCSSLSSLKNQTCSSPPPSSLSFPSSRRSRPPLYVAAHASLDSNIFTYLLVRRVSLSEPQAMCAYSPPP